MIAHGAVRNSGAAGNDGAARNEPEIRTIETLVLEDDPDDLELLRAELGRAAPGGFRVTAAGRLAHALEHLEQSRFDLLLTDLHLPDSQGLDTFHALRERAGNAAVVVLSGSDFDDSAALAVRDGAQDYIVKGELTGPALLRAISNAVERKQQQCELAEAKHDLERVVAARTAELTRANAELSAALRAAEQSEAYFAHYDAQTGLPNRVLFADRLSQAVAQAGRMGWPIAVMLIDLDRFQVINETLGYATGDALLRAVGRRIDDAIGPADTVSRLAADEFGVIVSDIDGAEAAAACAEKILAAFGQPFAAGTQEVFITPSIGVALCDAAHEDCEQLLSRARAAMAGAKEAGRNRFALYRPELKARPRHQLAMETALRHALERGEFVLHYQPKVEVAGARIRGAEALIRWQKPGGALVPPMQFIPLLEETGLIVPAGAWVLEEACRQVREWRTQGIDEARVAVNLSTRQLCGPEIGAVVRAALDRSRIPPHCIELEITESLAMLDVQASVAALRALKEIGVLLTIDDFGTGHSSLAWLRRFAIDHLKIDRSFIADLAAGPNDGTIATAIITLARQLGLRTIAEGVETWAQLDFLAEHGCDEYQGYLFSRPLPADGISELWLNARAT